MDFYYAIQVTKYLLININLALNLARNSFNPSLLLALDDPILPYPFLKLCLDSYIGTSGEYLNPLVSPLLADD